MAGVCLTFSFQGMDSHLRNITGLWQLFLILMHSLKIDLVGTIAIILECANLIPLEIHLAIRGIFQNLQTCHLQGG